MARSITDCLSVPVLLVTAVSWHFLAAAAVCVLTGICECALMMHVLPDLQDIHGAGGCGSRQQVSGVSRGHGCHCGKPGVVKGAELGL